MPSKKSSGPPKASVVQQNLPDGVSRQLWELSKSTSHLVEKLTSQETEEDIQQGCSKAEARSIAHFWRSRRALYNTNVKTHPNHAPIAVKTCKICTSYTDHDDVQVAKLLWHETAQKTGAGEQRRKEALEHGIVDKALQGVQSNDASLMESCAGALLLFAQQWVAL